ncbi:MAG: DNA gyrase inhibitor YacG [Myxococcota bacterium]
MDRPCPICGTPVSLDATSPNRDRPFCSKRCRMIDLDRWLSGDYAIPGDSVDTSSDDTDPDPAILDHQDP